jgi:uncharacterized SAM-binding protein YcdF (DUF218 family)
MRHQRLSTGLLIGLSILLTNMFLLIYSHGTRNNTTYTEDCVLVLGCGIRGEKVLTTLQYRLDKCLEYLQHNPEALVVVSGGQDKKNAISEAAAMKRYLVSKGVDAAQIVEEDQSKNTRQNMQFSRTLLNSRLIAGNYSVVCITSDYHAYRAGNLAKKAKLKVSHYNAKTAWYLYPVAYCTETLSIFKMWINK